MARDMDAVINAAIDSAVDDGTLTDVGDADETVVDTDTSVDTEAVTEEASVADTGVEETTAIASGSEAVVDALMEELKTTGYVPNKDPKKNRIPYPNVEKIIGNREKRAVEAVAKALGVEPTSVAFDKIETVLTEKLGSFANLESEAENFHRAEEIMLNDPDRYIRILATIEPQKYGKFVTLLDGKASAGAEEIDEDFNITLPEFDLDLGNGIKTYSPEGIQKAFQAIFKQAVQVGEKRAQTAAQTTTEAALRPLKDREARQEETRYLEERHKEITAWRGMDKHYDTWLKALQADTKQATVGGKLNKGRLKYRTPEQAYIDVVVPLLQDAEVEKEQKAREKLIADSNKKATSTSVTTGAVAKKKAPVSDDPVTDAIERALAKAGL